MPARVTRGVGTRLSQDLTHHRAPAAARAFCRAPSRRSRPRPGESPASLTRAPFARAAMGDNQANNQIRQMVNFILQEAHEKANEIRIKASAAARAVLSRERTRA